MVLEATYLCIDNSDYMRNGDFAPSRMEAQQDAVNLLAGAKTQANPENSVGVLSMAGKGVEVHAALTSDVGKILSLTHGIKIGGEAILSGGFQVSQRALKHRQNKNQLPADHRLCWEPDQRGREGPGARPQPERRAPHGWEAIASHLETALRRAKTLRPVSAP